MNQSALSQWRQSTNFIFGGILILSVFGWIACLLGYFTGVVDLIAEFYGIANKFGGASEEIPSGLKGFYAAYYIFQFVTLCGWLLYLVGLHTFKNIQPTKNTGRLTQRLYSACWLGLIAILIGLINGKMNFIFMILFMITGWCLTLISYIKFMNAFGELRHCEEWNERAQSGAKNLRLSACINIWLIFWPVACLAVAFVIGGTAYQHAQHIYNNASQYYGDGMTGILDIIENYKGTAIAAAILLGLTGFVLSIMQFVLRLTGWRKIHNGFYNVASSEQGKNSQGHVSGFCHKCGAQLEPGSAFCHKCGTKIIVGEAIETPADVDHVSGIEETESEGRKNNYLIWGAIGLGIVLATALICLFSFGKTTDDNQLEIIDEEEYCSDYEEPLQYEEVITPEEIDATVGTDKQQMTIYDEPEGDEYTHNYNGSVNDKYAIKMTLTTDGGAYYTGEYFYTKNKTPIQLRGQLIDDYEHLVLEEYVGMNMTGKFDGILSRSGYRGTWTSADGETSYPFNVTE